MDERYIKLVYTLAQPRVRNARFRQQWRSAANHLPDFFRPLLSKQGFRSDWFGERYVDAGKITVYCPDAIDLESFYKKSIHPADRMRTHNAYENVIVRDVFDLARREYNSHRVAVCGASLGAYHAANIAFRQPDVVSHLISLSGSFDISSFFNGYYDDNIYFNSPYEYLPNTTDPWKYNHMGVVLGTGEWDNTRHESHRLSEILNSKGIEHWLDDGKRRGHDWNYWRDMLPYYLSKIV